MNKDAPELRQCTFTWLGDPPAAPSVDAGRQATITAASINLCEAEATVRALSELAFDSMPPYREKKNEELARFKSLNKAVLESADGVALACNHPLVVLVPHCRWLKFGLGLRSVPVVEGNRYFESVSEEAEIPPECAAAQVKDTLEAMRSDQFNPHPDLLPKGEGDSSVP